jgi:cobalamin biosynthesis protein CobD/CbiB
MEPRERRRLIASGVALLVLVFTMFGAYALYYLANVREWWVLALLLLALACLAGVRMVSIFRAGRRAVAAMKERGDSHLSRQDLMNVWSGRDPS